MSKMPSYLFFCKHPSPLVSAVTIISSLVQSRACNVGINWTLGHQIPLRVGELITSLLLVPAGLTSQEHPCYDGSLHAPVLTFTITRINYLASRHTKHHSGSCEKQIKQAQNYIISMQKTVKGAGSCMLVLLHEKRERQPRAFSPA